MKKAKYFTASWCGPCKSFKPIIKELIAEGLPIEIVDIDTNVIKSCAFYCNYIVNYVVNLNIKIYKSIKIKCG